MAPYTAKYAIGSIIRIAPRVELERFLDTWRFHNPLRPEQLRYADEVHRIIDVSFIMEGTLCTFSPNLMATCGTSRFWRRSWRNGVITWRRHDERAKLDQSVCVYPVLHGQAQAP